MVEAVTEASSQFWFQPSSFLWPEQNDSDRPRLPSNIDLVQSTVSSPPYRPSRIHFWSKLAVVSKMCFGILNFNLEIWINLIKTFMAPYPFIHQSTNCNRTSKLNGKNNWEDLATYSCHWKIKELDWQKKIGNQFWKCIGKFRPDLIGSVIASCCQCSYCCRCRGSKIRVFQKQYFLFADTFQILIYWMQIHQRCQEIQTKT